VVGLLLTFAWTALCLGGYFAPAMVVSGPTILALGGCGAVLWALAPERRAPVLSLAALVPIPFLLFALVGTLAWAPAGWRAWQEWLLWFQMWIVFVLVLHFGRSTAHTWTIVGTFGALVVVGFGIAVYQRFSDPYWITVGRRPTGQYWGRASGMFGIPNSFAGFLELIVPVCLTLLTSRSVRPRVKILCAWVGGLGLLALALTVSRGGWLSLGLALLCWPALAARHWKKKFLGLAIVATLIGGAFGGLYQGSEYVRQRLEPFFDGRFELSRPNIWRGGARIWADHPWMGSGPGSFAVTFDRYRPPGYRDQPAWAHNDYLNTLTDYGVIGFALWAGAGVALLGLGWRRVRRAQHRGSGVSPFGLAKWKLGLWLGLLAFALHLCVDFHTKIPALAYAAAIVMGLLLRDSPDGELTIPRGVAAFGGASVALGAFVLAIAVAPPLYQGERLRAAARSEIDRHARLREGDPGVLGRRTRTMLLQAVRMDPTNGQAWADLAYATAIGADTANRVSMGHAAELAADRALVLCPDVAEYWVRKGVALDLQLGRRDAESCFQRATALAPNSAVWWYYYARHLHAFPERSADAQRALATCLTLDPYYPPAERLRQRFPTGR
jgi:hypothetical protein